MVVPSEYKKSYTVQFIDEGNVYAELEYDDAHKKVKLQVKDDEVFRRKAVASETGGHSVEGQVLRAITKQVAEGESYKFGEPEAIVDPAADVRKFEEACVQLRATQEAEEAVVSPRESRVKPEAEEAVVSPRESRAKQEADGIFRSLSSSSAVSPAALPASVKTGKSVSRGR